MIQKHISDCACFLKLRVLILIISYFPGIIFAQHYFARNYNVADGIPSSIVNDIAQDTSGMIWCATRKGICRYDGQSWLTYHIGGITGYGYSFIKCDQKGTLWTISNYNNIIVNVFNGETWEVFPTGGNPKITLDFIAFEVYYESASPVIVAATFDSGLFIWKRGNWKYFSKKNGLSGNYINGLTVVDQTVYIATENGISLIKNNLIDNRFGGSFAFPSREILNLKQDNPKKNKAEKRKLWVLGKDWLGYIKGGKFNLVTKNFVIKSDQSISYGLVCPDDEGGVYFGNYLYLWHYSGITQQTEHLGRKNGFVGEGVMAMLIDREKNTWIAGQRGVTCIPFTRFLNSNATDGLFDNEVSSALEISPGRYVFGHDGGLTFYDGKKYTFLNLESPDQVNFHEKRVQDIYLDQDKNLWVAGSNMGLARINPARQIKWYREPEGIAGKVTSVAGTPNGKIYIATTEGLYTIYRDRIEKVVLYKINGRDIRKIFPVETEKIYLATYNNGLVEINGNKQVSYLTTENKQGNSVFSFLIDSKKRTWVGTSDGLYTLNGRNLVKYTKNGCAIDRPVYLILEDHRNTLWFGTDDGIYRWNEKKLSHFTVKDGLSGQEINRDAGFIDDQDFIWFGTNNGLTRFSQNFDEGIAQIPPPLMFLKTLTTQSDTFPLSADINLPNEQNDLEFSFQGVSFLDEKRVSYLCKLEPFDQKWSHELSSAALIYRYHNVPAGKYRFCVKTKNALGVWSEPVYSAVIRIAYPFYMQWWFIGIVIIIIGIIIYFIFRFVVSRQYNEILVETVSTRTKELQESERALKKSNLAKDKFFSIIAHDLRSPFNALLGYLDLLTDNSFDFTEEERRDVLSKLKLASLRTLNLLDNLLSWARTQKDDIPVNPATINLTEIISENIMLAESAAASKKIHLVITTHESFFAFADKNMINTVVRNLISNAVKFTFQGGHIDIGVRYCNDETEVTVKDTGCGISPANQEKLFSIDDHLATKGTNKEPGTGLGLILCMEFIILNKGKLWVNSEEGKGSTFCFTLPKEGGEVTK